MHQRVTYTQFNFSEKLSGLPGQAGVVITSRFSKYLNYKSKRLVGGHSPPVSLINHLFLPSEIRNTHTQTSPTDTQNLFTEPLQNLAIPDPHRWIAKHWVKDIETIIIYFMYWLQIRRRDGHLLSMSMANSNLVYHTHKIRVTAKRPLQIKISVTSADYSKVYPPELGSVWGKSVVIESCAQLQALRLLAPLLLLQKWTCGQMR